MLSIGVIPDSGSSAVSVYFPRMRPHGKLGPVHPPASFSQERMQYLAEASKVVYRVKDGTDEKVFDALEWLAAMCSPHPGQGGADGPVLKILQHYQSRQFNW